MSARKLILHMSVSLDGFVARRDGDIDWLTPDDGPDNGAARHRANLELLGQVGLIVLGRHACEQMAPAWASSDSPMAKLMNATPKVVYSQSLSEIAWDNTRISRAALADEIPALKAEGGKDMVVFGGGTIGNSLIRERLVDEYRLTIQPVALGDGIPLMHGLPEPQRFEMVGSTVYADGSISQVLVPG
jgi:dihydrofolate reductase